MPGKGAILRHQESASPRALSIVKIRFWLPGRFVLAGFRGGLEKMLSPTGDRGFESSSLQRRVTCEPELRFSRHRPALLWIRRAREKRLPPPLSALRRFLEWIRESAVMIYSTMPSTKIRLLRIAVDYWQTAAPRSTTVPGAAAPAEPALTGSWRRPQG